MDITKEAERITEATCPLKEPIVRESFKYGVLATLSYLMFGEPFLNEVRKLIEISDNDKLNS